MHITEALKMCDMAWLDYAEETLILAKHGKESVEYNCKQLVQVFNYLHEVRGFVGGNDAGYGRKLCWLPE